MPTCADDLTAVDIAASPAVQHRITAGAGETINLFSAIDRDHVFGVNISVQEDAKEVIKPWHDRESMAKFAESNVDDQLIIHVPFIENVRIRSVLIKQARGEEGPRRVRIFLNRPGGMDFNDVESFKPQQDISLLEGVTDVTEYPVRVAAFANVNSCTLLFSDAPSTELSRIYYVGFKGEMRAPRKEASDRLHVPAANAADAPVDRLAEKAAGRQNTIR